ncbi:MAG: hypothetical protein V1831_02710 [Candidatus Woesearchaeota archaeon]
MADYETASSTKLGAYLNSRASDKGISRTELEKILEIEPIRVVHQSFFSNPYDDAVKKFDKLAEKYDVVVELDEGLVDIAFLPILTYRISGVGIREK